MMTHDEFEASAKKFCDEFHERLAATQDRNEIEALRKTFRRHMDEVRKLPAALAEDAMQRLTDVQQEMEKTHTSVDNAYTPNEPVAYVTGYSKGRCIIEAVDPAWLLPVGMALYRSPTINEMETVAPVAWITPKQELHLVNYEGFQDWTPLYTAPPQREPLTIGQLFDLYNEHAKCQQEDWLVSGWLAFACAIERAHGIGDKNG